MEVSLNDNRVMDYITKVCDMTSDLVACLLNKDYAKTYDCLVDDLHNTTSTVVLHEVQRLVNSMEV